MYVNRPKRIQIEQSFFYDLISYAYLHGDPDDPVFNRIDKAFHRKLDAIERHNAYTSYKTGPTEEAREHARQEYLKLAGILESYRWSANHDVNVTHNPDADLLP